MFKRSRNTIFRITGPGKPHPSLQFLSSKTTLLIWYHQNGTIPKSHPQSPTSPTYAQAARICFLSDGWVTGESVAGLWYNEGERTVWGVGGDGEGWAECCEIVLRFWDFALYCAIGVLAWWWRDCRVGYKFYILRSKRMMFLPGLCGDDNDTTARRCERLVIKMMVVVVMVMIILDTSLKNKSCNIPPYLAKDPSKRKLPHQNQHQFSTFTLSYSKMKLRVAWDACFHSLTYQFLNPYGCAVIRVESFACFRCAQLILLWQGCTGLS